ncbi:Rab28-like protein, partial [Volvox carteri f. nagariensis]
MPTPGAAIRQRYKVVVLGAPAAGKTALVRRLADGSFVEGARQRGLDFYTRHIMLREDVTVALQLWDLSDCPCRPEDDHAPLSAYVFNSQAVLLVYDVSCPSSLEALRYALCAVEAASTAGGGTRPYLALVASKCDLQ